MKKIIVFAAAIMLLTVTPLLAVIGPIPIEESNVLPDGPYFGSVTITSTSSSCVEIKVDANETILVPINNFGIQAFGFNYTGDINCLDVTAPDGWVEGDGTMDGFGKFMEKVSGDGQTRLDPLYLQVCSQCGNLAEGDIVVKNTKGYTFAVHIADFKYDNIEYTTSAFFATQKTTEIKLAFFKAVSFYGTGIIVWATETEKENSGFYIYRAESADGPWQKISGEAIIPGKGTSVEPALYKFFDKGLEKNKTYYYKLEDIDYSGDPATNGPFKMVPFWQYFMDK